MVLMRRDLYFGLLYKVANLSHIVYWYFSILLFNAFTLVDELGNE